MRARERFELQDYSFITNVVEATLSFYMFMQTAGKNINIYMSLLDENFTEFQAPNSTAVRNVDALDSIYSPGNHYGWYDFNVPPDEMEALLSGTKTNYGFQMFTTLHNTTYSKIFYSREEREHIELRPKLTIICDMPEYIGVYAPKANSILRPNNDCVIRWHTNIKEKVKIELLKSGSVVEVIATDCDASLYIWRVKNDASLVGKDYSFRVSNATVSSSDEPVFEIISFKPKLTVEGGTGSGTYTVNQKINISANIPDVYLNQFSKWVRDIDCVADIYSSTTTVTMPNNDLVIAATWDRKNLEIPGTIKTSAFVDSGGIWEIYSKYEEFDRVSNYSSQDVMFLDYDVVVNTSGSYLPFGNYSYSTIPNNIVDSFFIEIENVANNNTIMRGMFSNEPIDLSVLPKKRAIYDTLFLPKGTYRYRLRFNAYPKTYIDWQGSTVDHISNYASYAYIFELNCEGDVLTVENGTGDGLYTTGDIVNISAFNPKSDSGFDHWESSSALVIGDSTQKNTTVVMGNGDCRVTAVYAGSVQSKNKQYSGKNNSFTVIKKNGYIHCLINNNGADKSAIVNILNMNGQLLHSQHNAISKPFKIFTGQFSSGVYMLQLQLAETTFTQKIAIY